MVDIDRTEGRHLFGLNPDGYDATRPAYPQWIFEELASSGALYSGAATLEIGPGTGRATRRLIEYGADPLTLVEPDSRFEKLLHEATSRLPTCTVLRTYFEDARLEAQQFDLAVAATSFHWIDPITGMVKLRKLLRNEGTAALIWNVLQDLDKPDPFHEATEALLSPLAASPSGRPNAIPFALDRAAREADARRGGFDEVTYSESRWSFQLRTEQVGQLYEGFSPIQRLDADARKTLLDALMRIAETQFGGVVERNVTSCMYRLS